MRLSPKRHMWQQYNIAPKKAVLHIGCATLLNHIQASGFVLLPVWHDYEDQPLLILFRSE